MVHFLNVSLWQPLQGYGLAGNAARVRRDPMGPIAITWVIQWRKPQKDAIGMPNTSRLDEKAVQIKLTPRAYDWLTVRADHNRRSLCREAVDILEAERNRSERRAARGALHAKGGAR